MKPQTIHKQLDGYTSLELDAHVSIDDVIGKVSQEMGELLEAIEQRDPQQIIGESRDLLINILSGSHQVGVDISSVSEPHGEPMKILPAVSQWHSQMAALRSRYSRDEPDARGLQNLV